VISRALTVLGGSDVSLVEFRVLGPLEVRREGAVVRIGAARQRAVLLALLTHANRVVETDRLVEYVWDDRPPPTARTTLQSLVLRLRRVLEPPPAGRGGWQVIQAGPVGYLVNADPDTLDLLSFEALARHGREALANRRPDLASDILRAALALWRSPVLAGITAERLRSEMIPRLTERYLDALEARVEADLALGRHAELVAELRTLIAEHPLRERLHGQLMRVLQRCGRRAEALEVYRTLRHLLAAELGLEPDEELRRLHHEVLDGGAPRGVAAVRSVTPRPPAQLPPDVPGFVGRVDQLAGLDEMISTAHLDRTPVPATAITGPAGVGKTGLAVHWARRRLHAFPDGQLYVDLCGKPGDSPLRPVDAAAQLLRALKVPTECIPVDLGEAAAMYRSALAGQQALVVLDDAAAAEQVRPLLPGSPGTAVLITSRNPLTGLVTTNGIQRMPLDVLTAGESWHLIELMLGAERVAEDPAALGELVTLCGRLPLALRAAAAHLMDNPGQTIAGFARQLARRGGGSLAIGAAPGAGSGVVQAATAGEPRPAAPVRADLRGRHLRSQRRLGLAG